MKRPVYPMPAVILDARPAAEVVKIPRRHALSIDGAGGPERPEFQRAIQALYGVAYTLKFARKAAHKDFPIGPLEGRWWGVSTEPPGPELPRDHWRWRLRIAVPPDVTRAELAAAIVQATTKKRGKLEHSELATHVTLEKIPSQRVGRALHVGPYADEPHTFRAIEKVLSDAGIPSARSHVEVYLNNPGRTKPARLKTVLLRETEAKARRSAA
jgi:hypothetical protein